MPTPWRSGRRTTAAVMERETEHYRVGVRRASDSSDFSSETVVLTLPTSELLDPSTYMVEAWLRLSGSAAGDIATFRIRENNISGTVVGSAGGRVMASSSGGIPEVCLAFARIEVTSPTTATYVVTAQRTTGAGTIRIQAESYAALRRVGRDGVLTT